MRVSLLVWTAIIAGWCLTENGVALAAFRARSRRKSRAQYKEWKDSAGSSYHNTGGQQRGPSASSRRGRKSCSRQLRNTLDEFHSILTEGKTILNEANKTLAKLHEEATFLEKANQAPSPGKDQCSGNLLSQKIDQLGETTVEAMSDVTDLIEVEVSARLEKLSETLDQVSNLTLHANTTQTHVEKQVMVQSLEFQEFSRKQKILENGVSGVRDELQLVEGALRRQNEKVEDLLKGQKSLKRAVSKLLDVLSQGPLTQGIAKTLDRLAEKKELHLETQKLHSMQLKVLTERQETLDNVVSALSDLLGNGTLEIQGEKIKDLLYGERDLTTASYNTSEAEFMVKIKPESCADVGGFDSRKSVVLASGLAVLCDTQTDGGGWIVIQRRINGITDFLRNWDQYKEGFGSFGGNFWFGNENIFQLTNQTHHELRVDLRYKGKNYYAQYSKFSISGEDDFYRLQLGNYSGDAGDSLTYPHNDQAFSTFDADHDAQLTDNCARKYHGAWWYNQCLYSNLNGVWASTETARGVYWDTLTGYYDSVDFSEMKIRPVPADSPSPFWPTV